MSAELDRIDHPAEGLGVGHGMSQLGHGHPALAHPTWSIGPVGVGGLGLDMQRLCSARHQVRTSSLWKVFFVPFSRDNRRTSTPKTIYILNQHDKGNVSGHFLSGLGSRVGCRNGFVNRGIKEVLMTKKQVQLTVP